jgi:hypothetical protein
MGLRPTPFSMSPRLIIGYMSLRLVINTVTNRAMPLAFGSSVILQENSAP